MDNGRASHRIDKSQQHIQRQQEEDDFVIQTFLSLLSNHVNSGQLQRSLLKSISISKNNKNCSWVNDMKKILTPSIMWGSMVGITQFVMLRRAGMNYMNRHLLKQQHAQKQYQTTATTTTTTTTTNHSVTRRHHPHHHAQSPFTNTKTNGKLKNGYLSSIFRTIPENNARHINNKNGINTNTNTTSNAFKEGWFMKPFSIAMDATVSLFAGIVVGCIIIDKPKFLQCISHIPLQEEPHQNENEKGQEQGQNPITISNLLCPDLLSLNNKVHHYRDHYPHQQEQNTDWTTTSTTTTIINNKDDYDNRNTMHDGDITITYHNPKSTNNKNDNDDWNNYKDNELLLKTIQELTTNCEKQSNREEK